MSAVETSTAPPAMGERGFVARVGHLVVEQSKMVLELIELFGLTVMYSLRGRRERGAVARQMFDIGNRSLSFISIVLAFLGMITVFQVSHQVQSVIGDLQVIGPSFIQVMVHEFGPTICGLMVATRVGSGIAAEIGSMVVTEQVDALKMSNADPVNYLIVPRFLACSLMLMVLTVYACVVATLSGLMMGMFVFDIHPTTFLSLRMVEWHHVVTGLVKSLAYGMAIPVIAAQSGLRTQGGSEGVGWATTMAVVNSSFAVIVLDLLISVVSFVLVY